MGKNVAWPRAGEQVKPDQILRSAGLERGFGGFAKETHEVLGQPGIAFGVANGIGKSAQNVGIEVARGDKLPFGIEHHQLDQVHILRQEGLGRFTLGRGPGLSEILDLVGQRPGANIIFIEGRDD